MKKLLLKSIKFLLYPLILIAFLLLGYFAINAVEREPLVIFAGGGSVKNFIETEKGVKIGKETFTNSVYINLPSEYVQTLLKEEIERFKDEKYDNHSFLYICLSAEKIDSIENNSKNAQVFEYYIGDDMLKVYCYNTEKCNSISKYIEKDTLSINELKEIVQSRELKVYTTSRMSGTYNAYAKAFGKEYLDSINAPLFFENDSLLERSIILSSEYYEPKTLKNIKSFYIEKDSIKLFKQLYIYFVAFKQNDIFIPNTQIIEFLNLIDGRTVSKEKWVKLTRDNIIQGEKPIIINSFWE